MVKKRAERGTLKGLKKGVYRVGGSIPSRATIYYKWF
jgi:hypothetical protein